MIIKDFDLEAVKAKMQQYVDEGNAGMHYTSNKHLDFWTKNSTKSSRYYLFNRLLEENSVAYVYRIISETKTESGEPELVCKKIFATDELTTYDPVTDVINRRAGHGRSRCIEAVENGILTTREMDHDRAIKVLLYYYYQKKDRERGLNLMTLNYISVLESELKKL